MNRRIGSCVLPARPRGSQTISTDLTTTDEPAAIADWRELVALDDPAARNARCRAYLERLRWPDGARCRRCEASRATPVRSRHQLDCRACGYRFSVTSGTSFHDSGVPLWKWLVAVSLLVEADNGFPAHRLAGAIGVSYKTAWSLGHRIRAALNDGEGRGDRIGLAKSTDGHPRLSDGAIAGSYHRVSLKYLPAYLAERDWRTRNRTNPDAFRDALLALLRTKPALDTRIG